MTTRRDVLRGGAAAAASWLWAPALLRRAGAETAAEPPLRGGQILPTPDFAKLRAGATFAAGVRPHRTGGINLSRNEIATPGGTKFLIHNYGHSGAGITLSWGCASVVQDHVGAILADMRKTKARPTVAVLGCGVIGLTVASELRRKWPTLPITVYAQTLDVTKTTSFIAGGQFEPSQIYVEYENDPDTLKRYVTLSAKRIREIMQSGQRLAYGVAVRKNYTLDDADPALDDFTPHDVVPPFTRGTLPFAKLNDVGREYATWLMNPKILLPRLVADLRGNGVKFTAKQFTDRQQVEALAQNIIVNCTGYGSKTLFEDHALHARRGHLAVLKNPALLTYFFAGGCKNDVIAYMFARQSDIVVGGTIVPGDERNYFDNSDPADKAIGKRLLDNIELVFNGHSEECLSTSDVAALPPRLVVNR